MDSSPCLSNWAAVTRLLKEEGEQDSQHMLDTDLPEENVRLHFPAFANPGHEEYLSLHLALRLHKGLALK